MPKWHMHRLFKQIFIVKLMICQIYDRYIQKSQCIFDGPWPNDSIEIDREVANRLILRDLCANLGLHYDSEVKNTKAFSNIHWKSIK